MVGVEALPKECPPVPQETAKLSDTQKLGGRLFSVDQSRCLKKDPLAGPAHPGGRRLSAEKGVNRHAQSFRQDGK